MTATRTDVNEAVQNILREMVDSGDEVGLQVAAYVDGESAVDAWAGVADESTGMPVSGDTLFTCWSTTKGFAATCAHILIDRGKLDLDAPVASYWPEFAVHGKGEVTVADALCHRAGVPHLPAGTTPELICDWDAMSAAIAALEPQIRPRVDVQYHAWTFGWIVGELVRRTDGRPIAQFARDELCEPLGIDDLYLGIPDEVEGRVARIRHKTPPDTGSDPTGKVVLPPGETMDDVINRPDVRRASIPAAGGIMSARAIARHYAMLGAGGELEGVRVLSAEAAAQATAFRQNDMDAELGERTRRALGYSMGGEPAEGGGVVMGGPRAFGHGGYGGSMGFADPDLGLSFGLTKTLLVTEEASPEERTAYKVAEAIRGQLAG